MSRLFKYLSIKSLTSSQFKLPFPQPKGGKAILSIPLLKEMIAYDREGNFDRVIAFMLCILQSKEMHETLVNQEIKKLVDIDPFFRKAHFTKHKLTSWTGDNI